MGKLVNNKNKEGANKFKKYTFFCFWCAPLGDLYFLSFQSLNEPGLGAESNPGMALTPFPSCRMGQDSNPRPFDRESSLLSTRPGFCPQVSFFPFKITYQYARAFYKL